MAFPAELQSVLKQSDISLGLPPRRPVRGVPWDPTGADGWAAHYGGIQELVRYASISSTLPVTFDATWTHGVIDRSRYDLYPLQIVYGYIHPLDRLILVINPTQREALTRMSYSNVHAIGAPFVYAKPSTLPLRIPGSVLLMPPHTLSGSPFECTSQIDEYSSFAYEKYGRSSAVVYACVHQACLENGQWWRSFLKYDIPVVAGAEHSDANSYKRMWRLFSTFDIVSTPLTNGEIGSHAYYALSAGCRLVLEGPRVEYSNNQVLHDFTMQRLTQNCSYSSFLDDQDMIDYSLQMAKRFASPMADPDFGMEMVGMPYRRSPKEIRSLLGWSKRSQIRLALSRFSGQAFSRLARMRNPIRSIFN